MNKINVYPSLLGCDLANVEREIRRCEEADVDGLHYDVMDGNFVYEISFGEPLYRRIRQITELPVDVHLMTVNPLRYIEAYEGANSITAHIEALIPGIDMMNLAHDDECSDIITERMSDKINRTTDVFFNAVRAVGAKTGIAISPNTPAYILKTLCETNRADIVLVMTVEPGKGAQQYINTMTHKIMNISACAANARRILKHDIQVCVDGGINSTTAGKVCEVGATGIVAGSFLFGSADMSKAVKVLRGKPAA